MALSHNPSIIRSGLVLCLDAANRKSYPGSGTTWTDLSRSNISASLLNGPTFSNANGGLITLDGSDDYIDTNYTMPLSNFTISCVFKRTSTVLWAIIWSCEFWNNSTGYISYIDPTAPNNLIFGRANGSTISVNPNLFCDINNLNYYTFSCDSSANARIYINGQLAVTGTIILSLSIPFNIKLGCRNLNNGAGVTDLGPHQIAMFHSYNRVLSDIEIRQNFEAHRDRYGI